MTDRELKQAVVNTLNSDMRLRGKAIDVDVHDGSVVLRGQVPDIAEKRLAVNLVRVMLEVGSVRDQLRLLTSKDMTGPQVEMHIRDAWAQDPTIHETSLDVVVKDGVATLTGVVDSLEEKRLAGLLAWWVPGVADVENMIEVAPEQDGTEGDLMDALRLAFEKDVLVNEDTVSFTVAGGTVTLLGTVSSEEERLAAEHDAYYIWGVRQVINQLEIFRR